MSFDRLQDRCVGRWRSLLPALGVSAQYLTGKHGPCPCCEEGKDRFRFDDKGGNGTWFCNRCRAGNGVDLVMRVNGWDFAEARKRILELLPSSVVEMPRAQAGASGTKGATLWQMAAPLHGVDPASLYLSRRGIRFQDWPNQIRFLANCRYYDDGQKSTHPAMIAQFIAPDMRATAYQVTYLTKGGKKADLPKPRKIVAGCKIPQGGAVRLAKSAETMGIAEGVETALSAMKMFDVPVWASFSDANLARFTPPEWVKNLIIFADNDESFAGQCAAYTLAYKLKATGLNVEVRLPDFFGHDWNDVLQSNEPSVISIQEAAE